MCPICKKNGGLLPCNNNIIPVNGIHIMNGDIQTICYFQNKCNAKLKTKNGYCKNNGNPHFGGFCKTHKISQNSLESTGPTGSTGLNGIHGPVSGIQGLTGQNGQTTYTVGTTGPNGIINMPFSLNTVIPIQGATTEPFTQIIPNLNHICNTKFKTKEGFCMTIGKSKYGGKCGFHKLIS
jgi:hypothetical protein